MKNSAIYQKMTNNQKVTINKFEGKSKNSSQIINSSIFIFQILSAKNVWAGFSWLSMHKLTGGAEKSFPKSLILAVKDLKF